MSSAEARQAVYERARKALVAQLRFNQPALEKADIAKERLALEEAIRKVEAEVARKSRNEIVAVPRPARRPAGAPDGNPPPADAPWAAWPAEVLPDFREQLFSELSSPKRRAAKEFREIQDLEGTDKAAESTRQNREVYEQAPEDLPAEEPTVISFDQPDPHQFDAGQERDPEPAYEPEERPLVVRPVWTPTIAPADKDERTRPALSYGALARLVVVLIVLAGVVATTSWQWSSITEAYRLLSHTGSKPQPKFSGSLRQERDIGRSPGTALLGGRTAATVAQQVVLHEEDRNDQQHRQYTGSAIWHTELVSPGAVPELVVRADAEVPERRMTVAWSLRRNIDKSLPASHTIEIKFNVPADFPGGGIANVSGILMAQAEETRGNPLAGLAVKVTDGLFIIGLSAVDPEMQRNEQLIKGRSWFYIPIVYTNGGRAILAMKKGPPGDRALAEAFAAWEKK